MQTFVPCDNFRDCAKVLDRQRLGKQRLECRQILTALHNGSGAWYNHPAVQMWEGFEPALRQYMRAVIMEWTGRGYRNSMVIPAPEFEADMPPWWGGPIHATHRAALLDKNPEHYSRFGWTERPGIDYYWPTGRMTK